MYCGCQPLCTVIASGLCDRCSHYCQVGELLQSCDAPVHLLFSDECSTEHGDFVGPLTEANPPLYVDVRHIELPATFTEAVAAVLWCRDAMDELRKKQAFMGLIMHQICALVEHVFCAVLPVPEPGGVGVWGSGGTREEQMSCLENLRHVMFHYASARLSLPYDRSVDAARGITMGVLMAAFDAVIRMKATDGVSMVTQALVGCDASGAQDGKPVPLASAAFDGKPFATVTEHLPVYSPCFLRARHGVAQYFAEPGVLFGWGWEKHNSTRAQHQGGDYKYVIDPIKEDPTLQFVKAVLDKVGVAGPPRQSNAPSVNDADMAYKLGMWFIDEEWTVAPEVAWYRGMHS